ncbi:hypothetical protein GGI16_001234 [Coemansia sp. S142-1]|nr:hypothetical protein GGI16_001234 [Coemansia sp. S142-1]
MPTRSSYSFSEQSAADIQGKAVTIARSLLYLTPAVTGIVVSVFPDQDTLYNQRRQYIYGSHRSQQTDFGGLYGKIVSELCQGGARSVQVLSKLVDSPLAFSFSAVSGLTSITHGLNVSCAPFAKLAYRNATTLKMLDLRIADKTDWTDLIYGGTTTSASYTSLISLALAISDISYSVTWTAIEDIAPFPVLSTLDMSGGYPFDDDLLFRGNGGTMKSLRIPFSAIARNMLDRFRVLQRSGVTQMARVCIDKVTEADKEFVTGRTDLPIKQQVRHIMEVALALKLWNDTTAFGMFNAVVVAPSTAVLHCLEFGNM